MVRRIVLVFVLSLALIGCSKEPVPEKSVMERVTIVQTEKHITFFAQRHGAKEGLIVDTQKAAEKWEKDHPEWVVKNTSTAAGNHGQGFFSLTLVVEKKN